MADDDAGRTGRRAFLAGAIALTATAACSSSSSTGAASKTSGATSAPTASPASGSNAEPTTSAAAPSALPPFVAHGRRDVQRVALTFHTNGDRGLAEQLLEAVEAAHVAITAFVVGSWLEANPDFAPRILDGGHELANHTYSHPTFPTLSAGAMTSEIVRCRDVLVSSAGSGGAWFRPSGTVNGTDAPSEQVLSLAAAAGYPTVLGFDVDPEDYRDPGADAIVRRTKDAVQPGSIVSLHFGHAGTVAAIPRILADLDRRGLEPVTAGTLLGP